MIEIIRKHPLISLAALFLLLRITTLLTAMETTFNSHELYQGFIASEFIEGLRAPFWDYQRDAYDGGCILSGLLAVPFFLLFGGNLLALKLVGLMFAFGTFLVLILLLEKYFDRQTTCIAGVLLMLAPPTVSSLSLMVLGSHTEAVFFGILIALLFLQSLGVCKGNIRPAFLVGLVAGLGIWFNYTNAIVLIAAVVTLMLSRTPFSGRKSAVFLSAFVIGLIPWILYNLNHGYAGFQYALDLIHPVGDGGISNHMLGMLYDSKIFFMSALPLSLGFSDLFQLKGLAIAYVYLGLIAFLVVPYYVLKCRTFSRLSSAELFFLIYPLAYVLFFGLSSAGLESKSYTEPQAFRYLAPFYLYLIVLTSVALRQFRFKKTFLTIFIILGVLGQSSVVFKEAFAKGKDMPGFDYGIGPDYVGFVDTASAYSKKKGKEMSVWDHAIAYADWENYDSFEEFRIRIQHFPETIQRSLFFYAGRSMFEEYRYTLHDDQRWARQRAALQSLDSHSQQWVYRGVGTLVFGHKVFPDMFQKNRASLQTFVPEAFVPEIFWGIGWDLREREVGDRKWVIEHFKSFSDPTRSHVLKGYDAHGTLLSELRRITDKEIDH